VPAEAAAPPQAGPEAVRPPEAQQPPLAPPPARPVYDPVGRTDAELQGDTNPVARAGETPDEAQARAQAANQEVVRRATATYDALGERPPRINVAANDAANAGNGAHTIERHGPNVTLRRAGAPPGTRTIEGRIMGDPPWGDPANFSYRWLNEPVMNRVINEYIRGNWDAIRSDLALDGVHEATFDQGNAVGEGFYNSNQGGMGPRNPVYHVTSNVTITIRMVPGSNPPAIYVVRAYPAGRGF
jgi:hypothetical protein